MKSKTDLPELIRAMSKSEKRYFTLDAQKSGRQNSRYLELFQAINDMPDYDEERLKEKFGANLPSDKTYLYDAIMRSMRDYRSSRSYSARIKEMILDSKYLYERGLYDQCEERLAEAKKLALELDDQLALLEINREEQNLAWNSKKDYEAFLKKLITEKDNNIDALSEEFKYLEKSSQLLMKLKKGSVKILADNGEGQNPFSLNDFSADLEPKSFHAKRRYLQCRALQSEIQRDFESVTNFYERIIEWWGKNPKFREEEFYRYFVDISNLLHAYANQGQYIKVDKLVTQLEKHAQHSFHDKVVVFQRFAIYKLMYYINTGRTQEINVFISKINKGLNQYGNLLSTGAKMIIIFNLAILLFIHNRLEECMFWCKKIIKEFKTSPVRKDILRASYLLFLIASFDGQEPDTIEKDLRSAQRTFQKEKISKEEFEWQVFDYLKKLLFSAPFETKDLLWQFKTFILEYRKENAGKVALGADELMLWFIESKLQKIPVIQIVQRNNRSDQT
ncbi:MAG TPA: hypothetical protein PKE06_14590 [Flavilitoribacter sp.]|nr:hypothetical protein [Flavilitoribacter sp.]HMQ86367.1 hypothetical protein [Flavilitoribacter sp.]